MDSRIYQDPDKADADEVLDLSDDVAQQAQSVSQLQSLVESQAQEIQTLETQLSSLSQALSSLQAQVSGMVPSVDKIPSIEESVNELSTGQSSQDFQIQGINSQLSGVESDVAALQTGKQDKGSYVKFRSSTTANVEFTTNGGSAQPFQLWYDYGNDGTKRQGLVINETGTTLGLFDSKGQKWLWRAVGQMNKSVKDAAVNHWNYVTFTNGLFIGMRTDSGTIAFNGGPSGNLYYSANQTISYPSSITLDWAVVSVIARADPGVYTTWVKTVGNKSFTYAMARTSSTSADMHNQIIVIGWLA